MCKANILEIKCFFRKVEKKTSVAWSREVVVDTPEVYWTSRWPLQNSPAVRLWLEGCCWSIESKYCNAAMKQNAIIWHNSCLRKKTKNDNKPSRSGPSIKWELSLHLPKSIFTPAITLYCKLMIRIGNSIKKTSPGDFKIWSGNSKRRCTVREARQCQPYGDYVRFEMDIMTRFAEKKTSAPSSLIASSVCPLWQLWENTNAHTRTSQCTRIIHLSIVDPLSSTDYKCNQLFKHHHWSLSSVPSIIHSRKVIFLFQSWRRLHEEEKRFSEVSMHVPSSL